MDCFVVLCMPVSLKQISPHLVEIPVRVHPYNYGLPVGIHGEAGIEGIGRIIEFSQFRLTSARIPCKASCHDIIYR